MSGQSVHSDGRYDIGRMMPLLLVVSFRTFCHDRLVSPYLYRFIYGTDRHVPTALKYGLLQFRAFLPQNLTTHKK
jgi:hypothetical protein